LSNVGQATGDFAGNERFATARAFVVKQNAVAGVHAIGFAVVDDDPMLSAVVVLLQTQACTWVDLDALDLESLAFVNAVVPAPRAIDFAVQGQLVTFLGFKLLHQFFDVLALAAVCHQHSIGSFNHDEVTHAHGAHQTAAGMDEGVGGIGQQCTPCTTLPWASWWPSWLTCHTVSHAPRSFQPASNGTIWMG